MKKLALPLFALVVSCLSGAAFALDICGQRDGCGRYQWSTPAPEYYPPPVYVPSPEELANNRAVEINEQGVAAFKRRDYREAIRLYVLALRTGLYSANAAITQRNLGVAYNDLGVEHANKGDWQEALRWYLEAQRYNSDQVIANNIASTQATIADMAKEAQRQTDLAVAQQRTPEIIANLRDSLPGRTLDGNSPSTEAGLDFMDANDALAKAESGAGLDFMDGAGTQAKSTSVEEPSDTSVVDARGPIGSLPLGLPRLEEVENSPGREAWLRGMDAVIKRDWELAAAWFGTAKLRDPTNQTIANAAALAQWTKDHRSSAAGTGTPVKAAGSTSGGALQLPQDSDLEFLFPDSGASNNARQATNSSVGETTDADRELLRPGMEEMIREMVDSLTPEELARLRTPLTPEERALLLAAPAATSAQEASDQSPLKTIWPPVGDQKPDAETPVETGLAPGAVMPPVGQ